MHALIKSVKSGTSTREIAIKKSIMVQLSESVKDIQLSRVEDGGDIVEAGNNLCSVIEAIFLHGLKDSLAHRFRRALADVDQRPEPNFWPPLLVISHRQIIDQISKLQLIITEIGQCRSWVRFALMDLLLSSYLMTIRQDPQALKPYYTTDAFIRDSELLDVAQKLIEGVETIQFVLPCNSSLLNTWSLPTLLLAGIWSPTLRSCPIASGVDIAQSIQSTSALNSETCSIASMVSHSSGIGQMLALNQDEALRIILAKHNDGVVLDPQIINNDKIIASNEVSPNEQNSTSSSDLSFHASSCGNSLNRQYGWSFDEGQANFKEDNEKIVEKSMEHSFNALIESYNLFEGIHIRTPDFHEVWQRLEVNEKFESASPPNSNEILKETETITIINYQPLTLTTQVNVIARERGLDNQLYECCGCKEHLYLNPRPQVCSFTGEYFCNGCMSSDKVQIPARIMHNWDFKLYKVSQKAYNCLEEIKDHPVIDFKTVNPLIYTAVEEMYKLQVLRNQLNYLRAYLYTCKEPIIEQLQKQMWPREYMYEHIHQYSISDLLQIKDGSLAEQLAKVVKFGTDHVLNCWLCSQKGFLCEICNQSKPLFPFDTENVFRCNLCSGIYHNTCLNASKPCPRCERKKRRDDLPIIEATIN